MKACFVTRLPLLAASFASLALAPSAAWSSACNEEVIAPIHFPKGSVCWSYRGNATTFVGAFSSGQNVQVLMSGEAASFDPQANKVVTSWRQRTPDVSGPSKFYASAGQNNILNFRTTASGVYHIGFYPCAMWGGQGQAQVCAR